MKKAIIFIVISLFFVNLPVCASVFDKDRKNQIIEQAKNAEKRKNFKSAFFNYEKLLFYYPTDVVLFRLYAEFCERNKYYKKAIEIYGELFKLTSDKYYAKKASEIKLKIAETKQAPDIKKTEFKKAETKPTAQKITENPQKVYKKSRRNRLQKKI